MNPSFKKNPPGEHYTPQVLAQFVVWFAFQQFFRQRLPDDQWVESFVRFSEGLIPKIPSNDSTYLQMQNHTKNIKILDLGAGDGAFLLATARFLENLYRNANSTDFKELKLNIFDKCIFGVDYNPQAVHSCREDLKKWILDDGYSDHNPIFTEKVEKCVGHQIRTGNVLLGDIRLDNQKSVSIIEFNEEYKKRRIFHWHKEFPKIFTSKNSGFDLILCNPPYVTKDISPEDNRLYRKLYREQLFVNRFNLYHLFFARVNDLLAPKGIAVFLTSNSVLTDNYSSKVRRFLLSHFHINSIIDFVSRTRIFPNVLQGTCILVMLKKNGTSKQKTRIIRTFDMKSLIQGEIVERCIPTTQLFHFRKFIPSPFSNTFKILTHLRKNTIRLKNHFKIQSGEIRPADKKIRSYYFKEIPKNLKPSDFEIILNGKNISPYVINLKENRVKARWYLRPENENERIFREKHTQIPRIVFQRITAREQLRRVVAGKIDQVHINNNKRIWVENNANYLLLNHDFPSKLLLSAEALLGIFNSLLINWYIHQVNLTAAIPPADLELIPLPLKKPEKHNQWQLLHQRVNSIQKLLQKYSSSSEILTYLCPVCTSSGEISQLQSDIDSLVFQLYELPENYQNEIIKQLTQHHQYFSNH
ncbi:MAG: Eco57I restriction-modification methylase domain-containing protein [Promethearchaeota archaeon]